MGGSPRINFPIPNREQKSPAEFKDLSDARVPGPARFVKYISRDFKSVHKPAERRPEKLDFGANPPVHYVFCNISVLTYLEAADDIVIG